MSAPGPDPDSMTMRERMHAGLPYRGEGTANETNHDGSLSARTSAEAARMTDRYQRLDLDEPASAQALLRKLLGSMGEDVRIRPPFHVDYGYNIHVGDRLFANFGLTILDVCDVRIGDDVQIGPHVQLLCPTHPLNPTDRRLMWEGGLPITIEDNVWLGGGAIVMPGVTVGHDSVVGAGAVVTKDIPPFSIAVGSPARVIRTIDPEERSGQYALENFPPSYREQVNRPSHRTDPSQEQNA
ncbi:sugar O-acetyltransferase [Kocuria massiliensis]|uniref:sugar O-acetyltransferase n=1 Tax=Kocuria massiliensis TaxID=1926282 RepID=UPI0022B95FED|nr:sugar O-acetyltransferase [Kocuria massiliensis]